MSKAFEITIYGENSATLDIAIKCSITTRMNTRVKHVWMKFPFIAYNNKWFIPWGLSIKHAVILIVLILTDSLLCSFDIYSINQKVIL